MSIKTLEKIIDYVDCNITEKPKLEEVAQLTGYSHYYCSMRFHELTGCTFRTYVQKKKLEHACVLLKTTDQRVVEIALSLGFSSHEAFTRSFTKFYKQTPTTYRKYHKRKLL